MLKTVIIDLVKPTETDYECDRRLIECEELINTFGGIVLVKKVQKKGRPNYKTFIGSGKTQEILDECKEKDIDLVIINNILKPQQIFNLTQIFKDIEIWDRVDLILKIFSKHAKSTESKLEIELASIKHMGPRIYRMGLELSQQGGGIGTSGIGETNTEIMKRHLQKLKLSIEKKLKHYQIIRKNHRLQRKRKFFKTIAIVGYTNAGKSSLLNLLTKKDVYIANELFATLDTRVGKLYLPKNNIEILVSDTIGFIKDMPPDLINAFSSTLSETVEADLILHVIDVSDPDIEEKIHIVEGILKTLHADTTPKIYVLNKIDIKKRYGKTRITKKYKHFSPVFISVTENLNIEALIKTIENNISI